MKGQWIKCRNSGNILDSKLHLQSRSIALLPVCHCRPLAYDLQHAASLCYQRAISHPVTQTHTYQLMAMQQGARDGAV